MNAKEKLAQFLNENPEVEAALAVAADTLFQSGFSSSADGGQRPESDAAQSMKELLGYIP